MPRVLSVDRKERGSVLSTLEIEPRTPTVKLSCSSVHPWFSGNELKKFNTGAYRARFSPSLFVSQSSDESIALVNSVSQSSDESISLVNSRIAILLLLMMMMPFICSYRNKNEPTAIYPSFG